jgi:hypothetical protein
MAATAGTAVANIDRSIWEKAKESPDWETYRAIASGAQIVPQFVKHIDLVHATKIEATIPDAAFHTGLLMIEQIGSGTAAHTVTLTVGTFDGTNNIATFNAVNESIFVYIDSLGNGTMLVNTGSVAMSATS